MDFMLIGKVRDASIAFKNITRTVAEKAGVDKVLDDSLNAMGKGFDVFREGMKTIGIPLGANETVNLPPMIGDDATEAVISSLPVILDPEAEAEKDRILSALEPGFFERDYDPLLGVLQQLPASVTPDDLLREGERRQKYLDVVSEKLGHHVMKNYGDFVRGMNEVAAVDQALQTAHIVAKNARRAIAASERNVARDLDVSAMSKRKQQLLELLDALRKLAEATALRSTVKRAQETRDFATALLTCIECNQSLNSVEGFEVTGELRDSTENLLNETIAQVDALLADLCKDFRPELYRHVLEAYAVLGDVEDLASKLQAGFAEAILDRTQTAVRTYAKTDAGAGAAMLRLVPGSKATVAQNGKLLTFPELVPLVPTESFRNCVALALAESFDVLKTHHTIINWQIEAAEKGVDAMLLEAADPSATLVEASPLRARKAVERVESLRHEALHNQDTMRQLLSAIVGAMQFGRSSVLETAVRRLVALLGAPAAAEPEHFLHILAWTSELMEVAKSFDEEGAGRLTVTLSDVCTRHFISYHRQNRAAVKSLLEKEQWKGIQADVKGVGLPTLEVLMQNVAERHAKRRRRTYEEWLAEGNPFQSGGARVLTAEAILQRATEANQDAALKTFNQTSIKVMKLLGTYVVLMDSFRDPKLAGYVVEGIAQLFQFYIFWCFRLYGDARALPELVAHLEGPEAAAAAARAQQLGGATFLQDGMTPRLREVLQHIVQHLGHVLFEEGSGLGMEAAKQATQALVQGSGQLVKNLITTVKKVGENDLFNVESQLPPVQGAGAAGLSRDSMAMAGDPSGSGHRRNPSSTPGPADREGSASGRGLPHGGGDSTEELARLSSGVAGTADQAGAGAKAGMFGGLGGKLGGFSAGLGKLADKSKGMMDKVINDRKDRPAPTPTTPGPQPSGGSGLMDRLQRPSVSQAAPQPSAGSTSSSTTPIFKGTGGEGFSKMRAALGNLGKDLMEKTTDVGSMLGRGSMAVASGAFANDILSSGNLYGMRERAVAAETIEALVTELSKVRQPLSDMVASISSMATYNGSPFPRELAQRCASEVDSLWRSVDAATDLREHLFRTGAQRLLQNLLGQLPDRIAATKYEVHDMSTDNSPWVDQVVQQFKQTTGELGVAGLDPRSTLLTLESAVRLTELAMVEGFSRVRKCSVEGRALMSLDLQTMISGLRRVLGPIAQQSASLLELRLADSFVKAYYSPEEDLERWMLTHPQFTRAQVEGLLNCMIEAGKLQRRTKQQLMASMP